jgi:GT2 family glycosyltransferase
MRRQPAEGHRVRASIIIVNYDTEEKLLRCLESVVRHTPPDYKIIILDNGSSDGAIDSIETDFSGVTLIRSQTNLGFGEGNNLATTQARGQYLAFLNPDTTVEEGWLDGLLERFEDDPQVGLVTSKILLADQLERINACGNAVHFTGLTLCRGFARAREDFDQVEEVDAVSGAAFAIRRELFEKLKGFDEDTFLYMEDTDLSLRARLSGWRILFAPDSVVLHDYALRITPLKVFYQERNRYLMLLKVLRWPTLLILMPAFLLAEVITWGFVLYNDRSNFGNKLRAYRWIIANWANIMRKRKATQALRRVPDRELLRHTTFRLDFGQASRGIVGTLAQILFNPLFFTIKAAGMMLIWW